MTHRIGVLVGSIAPESINRQLAEALRAAAPEGLELVDIDIAKLPLYDRSYDGNYPPDAHTFKDALAQVDALLIVSPEHNRSMPAVIVNALSWGSRPSGQNAFAGKKAAMAGITPSPLGTAVMQTHLRVVLSQLGVDVLTQPIMYLTTSAVFDESGQVTDSARGLLDQFWTAYTAFLGD